jgi:1-acyl-sn-glycerol-3-phosphate acyltransferase
MAGPESATQPAAGGDERAGRILGLLREIAVELDPRRRDTLRVTPGSSIDRDLGIDSLGRVELLARLERTLGIRLDEGALMEAETAGDILTAVIATGVAAPDATGVAAQDTAGGVPVRIAAGAGGAAPADAATLVDVLAFHVDAHGDRPHVRLIHGDAGEETVTYGELWQGAQRVAAGLRAHNLAAGDTVAIMLPTGREFLESYFGVLVAGCVPVPIYPPVRRTQIEDHLQRQAAILRNARAAVLIATSETRLFARLVRAQAPELRAVAAAGELALAYDRESRPTIDSRSIGLVQYTSGSTGDPKGVVLTHGNLLANIRASEQAMGVRPDDVAVSWLPLYHDMGLIGLWLASLYCAVPLVLMAPLSFLARPERWLRAIHDYRGTFSAAPNFAYEACVQRIGDEALEGLDLSSWRVAANGAEAVSPRTIAAFTERFAPHGFRPEAMTPMYGMAENAVALTIPPMGRGPVIDRIARGPFLRSGRAVPADAATEQVAEFVGCGIPIPGHEVRIVDDAGHEAGERREGRVQFHGPSSTGGYLRNPARTREMIRDGWLESGDRGYFAQGELFITGRIKDVIIRAGRNIHPEEIEDAVGGIERVARGGVAAFGRPDPKTGTEGLVVIAETRLRDPGRRNGLVQRIRETVIDITQLPPDDVALVRPGAVLKTMNGKIRRAACRRLYEEGRLDRARPAVWRQFAGMTRASALPALRRYGAALGAVLYAVRFWTAYRLAAPFLWSAVMILPGVKRRRRLLGSGARVLLGALGVRLLVIGRENIPTGGNYVIVANHASYLDNLVLTATLPADAAFVAKREVAGERIAGPFLRRLGTAFVERFDRAGGVEDAQRLSRILAAGDALTIYPEGTFDRMPGLRSFRMGAFVVAAENGVPVVPTALRGTRSIMRDDSKFVRKGRVTVVFGEPIHAGGKDWNAAIRLRDAARAEILADCGEPDLSHEPKPI